MRETDRTPSQEPAGDQSPVVSWGMAEAFSGCDRMVQLSGGESPNDTRRLAATAVSDAGASPPSSARASDRTPSQEPAGDQSPVVSWGMAEAFSGCDLTVQLSEGESRQSPNDTRHLAAAGVSDAGAPLPFLDQIQAAFGGHDVTAIRSHVGGDSAQACEQIGATAYATGNDIAFAGPPDLHTAAHEAAHVVQQRGGVQLEGGVGQAGDRYERAADEVADRVVAGESSEDLLGSSPTVGEPAGVVAVQRQGGTATAPRSHRRAQLLTHLVGQWRTARLLDAPFRPPWVGAFPPLGPARTGTLQVGGGGGPLMAGAAPQLVSPVPTGPNLRLVPPLPPVAPEPPPPAVGGLLVAGVAFLVVLLWPSETAPAWMDVVGRTTGEPYGSPEEYEWESSLTPEQIAYLRFLYRINTTEPDFAADGEGDPFIEPQPQPVPEPDSPRRGPRCEGRHVPRRGGNPRHDAYATKVTHSPLDYYVSPFSGVGINYDGLQADTRNVWEVKTGFGWFFNAGSASVTAMTLARFDAQKNLGIQVAASCGYIHLWAHPDRHVAALLTTRWGGIPPVLAIPE